MTRSWILLAAVLVACVGPAPQGTALPQPDPPSLRTPTLLPAPTFTSLTSDIPIPDTPPATPEPIPTPAPDLRPLTQGGCCAQPFWSPDGSQVWFIDHPGDDAPAGVWGVSLAGGPPQFISERLGYYSSDGALLVYPEKGQTYIQRVATGERWQLPGVDGRFIRLSPDNKKIAWQVNSSYFNFDRRAVDIWIANLDGSEPRQLARLVGGGLSGWFPDNSRLLVTARDSSGVDISLASLNIEDKSLTALVQNANLRGPLLSPQGGWIVYQVAFSGDPAQDGLWVVSTSGAAPIRLNEFGSYRWRTEGRLALIPLESFTGSNPQRLLEIEVATGETRQLTDPAVTPFRVANGDWAISPDGQHLVFLSADDRNLWLLDLP